MGLVDHVVNAHFGTDPSGHTVWNPPRFWGRPIPRLVPSSEAEGRIRAFLKMFYVGHLCITMLGYAFAATFADWTSPTRNSVVRHVLAWLGGFVIGYGLPEWALWRTYAQGLKHFTEGLEEASGTVATRRRPVLLAGIAVAAGVILLGAAFVLTSRA